MLLLSRIKKELWGGGRSFLYFKTIYQLISNNITNVPISSALHDHLEANCNRLEDGILLGDSGYGLAPYLLTPILHPATPGEVAYNQAHRRTRCIVERAFGQLKARFPCLTYLRLEPERCVEVIRACIILHNIGKMLGDEDFQIDNDDHEAGPMNGNNNNPSGQAVRNHIVANFFD